MFFRNQSVDRRRMLRGCGAAIALPMLSAMSPAVHACGRAARLGRDQKSPRRFLAMNASLGFHTPFLFPTAEGNDFELTPYLQPLAAFREKLTLLSGLSHPNQNGNNGHASHLTWLTSAQRPGLAGFRNSISLDQVIAAKVGRETRIPFLTLSNTGSSLSWTSSGVNIPAERSPAKLFQRLFIAGTEKEKQAEIDRLRLGRSILDTVKTDAVKLQRTVGTRDQQKLDEYFSAIRDLENQMKQNEFWTHKPKPEVKREPPRDVQDRNDIVARQKLMYDMIVLAIQTDSTRCLAFDIGGMNAVPSNLQGVSTDWHNLSHHGKDPQKIEELKIIEQAEFTEFARFLTELEKRQENGKSLLDHSTILFGSNLGNASSHDWHNLPILVAGGACRHGGYVAHDEKNNTPLANLFVSFAQMMGVEVDRFGSSTAAGVRGLEVT